jgi:urease accessory protein
MAVAAVVTAERLPEDPVRMERSTGACAMTFDTLNGRSRIADLYQLSPCRLLLPSVEADEAFTAVLVTTSGGLAGGDRIDLAVDAGIGTSVVVTSQAAEKIYRSLGEDTRVSVMLKAAADSWLEWIPQGAILFDRSRLIRRNVIDASPTARVLAGEIVVFGRTASGEVFRDGLLHDGWQVRIGGRLTWADAVRLDRDIPAMLSHPAGFGGAVAMATVLYVAPDSAARLDLARGLLADASGKAGASVVNDVLITRFLNNDAQALRGDVSRFWCGFRAAAAGLPPTLPRVWHC